MVLGALGANRGASTQPYVSFGLASDQAQRPGALHSAAVCGSAVPKMACTQCSCLRCLDNANRQKDIVDKLVEAHEKLQKKHNELVERLAKVQTFVGYTLEPPAKRAKQPLVLDE